jgi:hypothetical protein
MVGIKQKLKQAKEDLAGLLEFMDIADGLIGNLIADGSSTFNLNNFSNRVYDALSNNIIIFIMEENLL